MEAIQEIVDVLMTRMYWLTLIFVISIIVFILGLIFHKIVSSEIKHRGIEYSQIAVNKISRVSTALMILSIVSIVVTIIVLSIN
ncbi:MAG: hypothetical protein ACOCRO_07820 [Halanaerobiales bacterium]